MRKGDGRTTSAFSPTCLLGDAFVVKIGLPAASEPPSRSSILVVDDEEASGELVVALLHSQGFRVRLARSGREGLDVLAEGGVDLLILDLMMSKLDGAEVCAHIRGELQDLFLPIIIMTSLHDRESRIRAKEAGADDVLVKPLDGLELLVRIDSLLRLRASAGALLREREQAQGELLELRAQVQHQQRSARLAESAGEALRELIEDQWRELELARARLPQAAREHLQRCAELTGELRHYAECLGGTGTVTRMPDHVEAPHGVDVRDSLARLRK